MKQYDSPSPLTENSKKFRKRGGGPAGMRTKRVRVANLPPETPDEAVRLAFSTYGEIKEIQEERWSGWNGHETGKISKPSPGNTR